MLFGRTYSSACCYASDQTHGKHRKAQAQAMRLDRNKSRTAGLDELSGAEVYEFRTWSAAKPEAGQGSQMDSRAALVDRMADCHRAFQRGCRLWCTPSVVHMVAITNVAP